MERVFEANSQGDLLDEFSGVAELFGRGIHLEAQEVAVGGLVVEATKETTQVRLIDLAFVRNLFQRPETAEVGRDVLSAALERSRSG